MADDFLDLDPSSELVPRRGRLLISEPYLVDPYFRRTVVLLCAHNNEGSFGFVLNRYIDMGINDLLDGMPQLETRISIGGPVQSGNLYYLHTFGKHIDGSAEVIDGVHMGGDLEQIKAMLATDVRLAKHVRFFVGYSGWGQEQLQRELTDRSWLVSRADKQRVMNTALDDLWADTLRFMGDRFAPLANFPEDPSLN